MPWKNFNKYSNFFSLKIIEIQVLKNSFFHQEVDIINRNKAGADNMKKLLQIQDRVEGWKGLKLLENNRRFIKEGPLLKISKNKQQERYFFLLSDLLIYCAKSKISSNYIFKKYIDLTKMQLEDLADTKTLTNAFQITRTDKNRTYVLIGATSKDKASWIRELELQLAEIHSGGNSHSKSKRSAERPIWRPDVTTENCWKCNGKFTWKNRRVNRKIIIIYIYIQANDLFFKSITGKILKQLKIFNLFFIFFFLQ